MNYAQKQNQTYSYIEVENLIKEALEKHKEKRQKSIEQIKLDYEKHKKSLDSFDRFFKNKANILANENENLKQRIKELELIINDNKKENKKNIFSFSKFHFQNFKKSQKNGIFFCYHISLFLKKISRFE